jgi:hypothetical protein
VTRAIAACFAAALVVGALVLPGAAVAGTITIGRGLGAWSLGRPYLRGSDLVYTQRFPRNAGPGCVTGVGSATQIDYHRALRTAWRRGPHGMRLIDVATMRAGDRSGDAFVIARSRLGSVKLAHPHSAFGYGKGGFALGTTYVRVLRRTGKETFDTLVYWFDARGVLTALEALAGGC